MQARKVDMPENTTQSYIAHFAPGTAFDELNQTPAVWRSTGVATRHHLVSFAEI